MNKIQFQLIELSTRKNIWRMSLRAIGSEIGVKNAATVKYHIDQLKERNLLKKPAMTNVLSSFMDKALKSQEPLVSIPILGAANCGIAVLLAEEMLEGYLKISPKLLPHSSNNNLFALRAEGDSMNQASIRGEKIEEGDYVIIDTDKTSPKNGDYVLSIIDGCANIKRMIVDERNRKIALISESSKNYPPIYIHQNDNYLINGVVVSVAKNYKVAS